METSQKLFEETTSAIIKDAINLRNEYTKLEVNVKKLTSLLAEIRVPPGIQIKIPPAQWPKSISDADKKSHQEREDQLVTEFKQKLVEGRLATLRDTTESIKIKLDSCMTDDNITSNIHRRIPALEVPNNFHIQTKVRMIAPDNFDC